VGAGKVPRAHKEFVYDLPTSEPEGLFKQFNPLLFRLRVVFIQPGLEGSVFFLELFDGFGVADGGVDLEAIADDASILQEFLALLISIPGNFINIEVIKGFEEVILLVKDGLPAQASLVDLQDQSREQFIIFKQREAIFIIMVRAVNGVFAGKLYEIAVAHAANLVEIRVICSDKFGMESIEKEAKKFDRQGVLPYLCRPEKRI
jgi:hypothetical protein